MQIVATSQTTDITITGKHRKVTRTRKVMRVIGNAFVAWGYQLAVSYGYVPGDDQ